MATVTVMANMASNKHQGPLWVLPLLLLPLQETASAADWQVRPRISLSERYSDNIDLRTNGLEQSDWVTTITPGVSLSRTGRRLQVHADYSLLGMLYADDSDRSRARHNLNGRANAELLEDWLYLDAGARVSQEINDYTRGIGVGDAVGLGNTSQVSSYSLSPYLRHRFASFATVEARVSQQGVWTDSVGATDSDSTQYRLNASSGADFHPLSWSASYDRRETDNSNTANSDSERGSVNFRLPLHRKYGLLGQAGMEKNNYTGASNRVRDYTYYGLGAFYTPGRRFSMDVYYNDSDFGGFVSGNLSFSPTDRTTINASSTQRNFGRSHALSLNHRTRKTNWGLQYSENITTYNELHTTPLYDAWSCPGFGFIAVPLGTPLPTGCTALSQNDLYALLGPQAFATSTVSNDFVYKSLIGTFGYRFRRSNLHLSLYQNQREYSAAAPTGSDQTQGMQASWSLTPGARTTITVSGGISQVDSGAATGNDDLWNMRLAATRRFQPKVSGSVELRHQERSSSRVGGDFAENSVAATLNVSF